MTQEHADTAQGEYPVAVSVEPPTVPVVDAVVLREVGLNRVRVLIEQTQQARYSPADSKPAALAMAAASSLSATASQSSMPALS
jgi:hypothetical protein